ncbi:MAG: hypothetical protein CM15mP98_03390 [Paracoccaceae bacterium]|jgi:hypothetical protein|nr:hypothetical protein [Bacteroidota bacterium]GIR95369.1 MAG: hypothetical protein CM15mP98_03390 [Paracoccaceae bacterium]|tara:strand:- start:1277 stop:2251 length:975 start_codon:yes stop_codon:yes gene_type:complete
MKNNFKETEELDIIVLIEKIKLMLLSVCLQIFRRSKNFLSEWKRLLAVILAGVLLGYFLTDNDKPSSKEATVLVKINFDAGNYVYDTVDLINLKISSEDTDFFTQEIKLNEDETIDEVSISPVIDIKDIMAKDIQANEIRALFENLEYEDGFSVTEGFKSDYDYHFIKVNVSNNSSIETINKVIDYFNNNPLFAELKERNLQRISSIISDNEQTIKQIDKLLEYYTTETSANNSQLYIDNKNLRPNELIKTKITLQSENQELKRESLTSKETVITINESNVLIENNSLASNKMVYYPFLFLLIYLIVSVLIGLYSYLDKLDRAS